MSAADREGLMLTLQVLGVVAGVVALFVTYVIVVSGLEIARRRRTFLRVPLRTIAACREGELVRIVGTVEAGEHVLRAPSDGTECVQYRSEFFSITHRRGRRSEDPYATYESARSFVLVSGAERAHVAAKGAEVTTFDPRSQDLPAQDRAPARVQKALARAIAGGALQAAPPDQMRYAEARLPVGAQVTVLGCARWEDVPAVSTEAGDRGGTRVTRTLTIVAPAGDVVRVSTDEAVRA